jgi:hypothetical protein
MLGRGILADAKLDSWMLAAKTKTMAFIDHTSSAIKTLSAHLDAASYVAVESLKSRCKNPASMQYAAVILALPRLALWWARRMSAQTPSAHYPSDLVIEVRWPTV